MGIFDGLFKEDGSVDEDKQKQAEDLKKVSFVKSKVEEARNTSTRIAHEGLWLTNAAYCIGFDSVYYDTTLRQYVPLGTASQVYSRDRIRVNKILPTVQNRLARLSKNRPKFQVRPNSTDNDDKEAARLSERVLDMIWESQSIETKRLELLMAVQQYGHAYLKVSWDPSLGRPMKDPDGLDKIPVEFEGDIRVDVCSPFEIFPDPLAKTLNDCKYIIQAKVRHLDYFKNQYPEKGDMVKAEDIWLMSATYEQRINSMGPYGPSQSGTDNQQTKNAAIEVVYYERRSPKHPNGRMIVCANGVLLEDKPLPCGEIPFAKFDDILIAGKYYSESVVTHLRPIQDQYNRIVSRRAKWANNLLAGKWRAAKGHNLIQESLNDQSGEVIEYTPVPNAPPPEQIPVASIPSYAYQEEQALEAIMNDISGINEVSRGQAPGSGVTAAVAFQYLSEQDDTRIAIVSKRIEEAMAFFGSLLLKYGHKYYKTPRVLKIAGQNMEYTVESFTGADIRGNTDVTVVEGSTLPGSITAKRDFVLALRDRGLLGDPADMKATEKVMKALEFGTIEEYYNDYGLDMNQIRKALNELKKGVMPPVNELDNHDLYVSELNRFRKTDEFDELQPEIKAMILSFMEAHIQSKLKLVNPEIDEMQEDAAQMEAEANNPMADPMAEGLPVDTLPQSDIAGGQV